jgi:phosphatidylglycerophosphate synthase
MLLAPSRRTPAVRRSAALAQAAGLVVAASVAAAMLAIGAVGPRYVANAVVVDVAVAVVVLRAVSRSHPFDYFGAANIVTTLRAALVAATAALIVEPPAPVVAGAAAGLALIVALLDGVDGWLARRTQMASPFGARFDMEVDALLILVLSILAWTLGKAGPWVVLAGAMRYLFVAAGWAWDWMTAPLPPSTRRKAVCVVQVLGLAAVVSPLLPAPASTLAALVTLLTLTWSFAVDTLWLWRHRA